MVRTLALILLLATPLVAHAQPQIDSLSRCLADNTTGKDRKDLARWVFLAMAAHPEITRYASPAVARDAQEIHKVIAGILMRLLTESCPQQTQAAFNQGGTVAIQAAFQTLGQLAMQELMSDADVKATLSAFQKYLDQNKLNQLFSK